MIDGVERPGSGAPYVFVSYASVDRTRVMPVVEALQRAGVPVWLDQQGIAGGENYALEITEAIERAAALMLFCSASSLASRNVKQEIALAWKFERPYLPLLLETVAIPKDVMYWLEAAQWVEVLDKPEATWLPAVLDALAPLGITPAVQPHEEMKLAGREKELALLREKLAAAKAGKGGLVLIGGEAGIGKTTLADALLRQAAQHGGIILEGHCFDLAETPPYGPFIDLFARYVPPPSSPPLPDAFAVRGTVGAVANQMALFVQMQDFLAALSVQRPVVMLLDDLHWADPASLDLLRFLSRSLASTPLLVLVTYRSDELTRRHPLYALLPQLARDAGAARIDLGRLDDDAVRALVDARYALPDAETDRLVAYLQERAEGNALFVGELLRALEEAHTLAHDVDGWRLGDLTATAVPALLRQVIDGRLARLDDESQRLLGVAAVIGHETPFALWAAVGEADEETLLDLTERGEEAHLLIGMADGTGVRFAHALIREALYEGLAATRRRRLHRAAGDALTQLRDPDPDAVAYHFQRAGDVRAAEWLAEAGMRAGRAFSSRTAVERYEAALVLHDAHGLDERERTRILGMAGYSYRFIDHRRALDYAAEAIQAAERLNDRLAVAMSLTGRAWMHQDVGAMREGLDDYIAARGILETTTAEERAAFGRRIGGGDFSGHDGGFTEYLAICGEFSQARDIGERLASGAPAMQQSEARHLAFGRLVPLGNCFFGLQLAYLYQGEPERAARAASDARFWYGALPWDMMLGFVARFELAALLIYRTERVAERGPLAETQDALHGRWFETLGIPYPRLGWLPVMEVAGEWSAARAIAGEVVGSTVGGVPSFPRLTLATIARAQGEPGEAWAVVREMLPQGAADTSIRPYGDHLRALRLAASLTLDAGDLTDAHGWLGAFDRLLARCAAVVGQSECQALWAQYHRQSGDGAMARAHAERALAHATDPRQPLALIAAYRLLGELDIEAGHFTDAETHLQESLALADACAAPYERALTLLAMADLRAATGETEAARALLGEVKSVCEPLGAKPTLARADALATRLGAG